MNGGLNQHSVDSEDGSLSPDMQQGKVFMVTVCLDMYVNHE